MATHKAALGIACNTGTTVGTPTFYTIWGSAFYCHTTIIAPFPIQIENNREQKILQKEIYQLISDHCSLYAAQIQSFTICHADDLREERREKRDERREMREEKSQYS